MHLSFFNAAWSTQALLVIVLVALSATPARTQLSAMADLPAGTFWFGTQLTIGDKLIPNEAKDGAVARVKKSLKAFSIDLYTVNNAQFAEFIAATGYVTEAETFTWSFVLEHLASAKVVKQVDSKKGYGRVKDSTHWMAVPGAYWAKPYGKDSPDMLSDENRRLPVVHVSHTDAERYCAWAGRRLPTEVEWEYAARGGRSKQSYPWGDQYVPGRMNVWEGRFPKENSLQDGYLGPAPVDAYAPNGYGLFNMVGNVWEWVAGGSADKRVLRGASFIDSVDGRFNHIALVSTRQENSGDSAASNVGFRCAADGSTPTSSAHRSSSSKGRTEERRSGLPEEKDDDEEFEL